IDFLAANRTQFKIALLVGSATELMKKNKNWRKLNVIVETDKMEKAVLTSFNDARKGDIILLSPAAASFNLFTDEFHRGLVFKKAFLKLK
ncbi:MAG: UDP-N-acetylmuramoylalanine-D-glutamate ligase, partial [Parcubacteria group bacterium GW2011_GWC2_42_13]